MVGIELIPTIILRCLGGFGKLAKGAFLLFVDVDFVVLLLEALPSVPSSSSSSASLSSVNCVVAIDEALVRAFLFGLGVLLELEEACKSLGTGSLALVLLLEVVEDMEAPKK